MICNQDYFINSIEELNNNFIKFYELPSTIDGCNVIDNIPSYLSISSNFRTLHLVQPIYVNNNIEIFSKINDSSSGVTAFGISDTNISFKLSLK